MTHGIHRHFRGLILPAGTVHQGIGRIYIKRCLLSSNRTLLKLLFLGGVLKLCWLEASQFRVPYYFTTSLMQVQLVIIFYE
jgi:hypothetical protein